MRNVALNDAAFAALAPTAADRIMEVGFGGGYLLSRLARVVTTGTLAGVDVSPVMVARFRHRYRSLVRASRLDLSCVPAESLPFASGAFTKACTVNSAFYWRDAGRAFEELQRVLAVGGCLVVCQTCPGSLEQKRFAQHGMRLFEAAEMEATLTRAGFKMAFARHAADRHREFFIVVATKPA